MTAPTEKKPAVLPASEPTEERLREALLEMRRVEWDLAHDCDCRPEHTQNWRNVQTIDEVLCILAKAPSHPPASAPEAATVHFPDCAVEWCKSCYPHGLKNVLRAALSAQEAERPSVMRADPAPEPLVYPAVQASGEKTLPSRRGSAE